MNDLDHPPVSAHRREGPGLRRRWAFALVALALVVAGCASDGGSAGSPTSVPPTTATADAASTTTAATASTTTPDDPADVAVSGTYAVGFGEFDLVDESRDTPENDDAPASEGRKLPTLAFYPAAGDPGDDPGAADNAAEDAEIRDGRYPLLVFSHGVTGRATFYQGELAAMASAGYVVIAPDYPLSNADSPGGPTINDVGNQPADASFLIDTFTSGEGPTAEVGSHVDAERVGAVGHSLGAITSLGIGYAECCIDERVDAVAAWAGVLLPLQDGVNPADGVTDRPLLLVHGDKDGTVPYSSSERAFDAIASPRWFITLPGGEHVPPYLTPVGDPQALLTTTATIDFFDAELKGDPTGIDRMDQDVADAGDDVATIEAAGQ